MLSYNPRHRPSAESVLRSPYFANLAAQHTIPSSSSCVRSHETRDRVPETSGLPVFLVEYIADLMRHRKSHLKTYLIAISILYQLGHSIEYYVKSATEGREIALAVVTIAEDLSEQLIWSLRTYLDDIKSSMEELSKKRLEVAKQLNFDLMFTVSYDYYQEFFDELSYREWQITKGSLFAISLPWFRSQHTILPHQEYLTAVLFSQLFYIAFGGRVAISNSEILDPFRKYIPTVIKTMREMIRSSELTSFYEYISQENPAAVRGTVKARPDLHFGQ